MNHSVDPRRAAWRLFLQGHARLVSCLAADLEQRTGLPLSWYDVLAQLHAAPGHELRLQDLVRSLVISKSGLTRRLDRMVAEGLVARRECAEDRRGAFAVLTEEGAVALAAAAPVHLEGIEARFLRYLTEQEAEALTAAFARILAGLEDCDS